MEKCDSALIQWGVVPALSRSFCDSTLRTCELGWQRTSYFFILSAVALLAVFRGGGNVVFYFILTVWRHEGANCSYLPKLDGRVCGVHVAAASDAVTESTLCWDKHATLGLTSSSVFATGALCFPHKDLHIPGNWEKQKEILVPRLGSLQRPTTM